MIRILTSQAGSGSDVIARIVSDELPGTPFGQRAICELAATVKSEMARWGRLIKEKGIREE